MQGDPELFGRLAVEIRAHVTWMAGYGWTVWVHKRLDGLPWDIANADEYGPLSWEELPTLLDAALSAAYLGARYPA